MPKNLDWERVGSEAGPDLILFKARYDQMRNPRTERTMRRLVLESVDWVNVVALTDDGGSVMVDQFRFGVSARTLETAGGMVDPGEEPMAAAARELKEETGYTGGRWRSLGAVQPNPAFHDHLCHHFLAEGVQRTHDPEPGPGEAIRVRVLSEAELKTAVADGAIQHVLALSALSRVFDLWHRPFNHR